MKQLLEYLFQVVWTITGACMIVVCFMFMQHMGKCDFDHSPKVDTIDMGIDPKMDSCVQAIKHKAHDR